MLFVVGTVSKGCSAHARREVPWWSKSRHQASVAAAHLEDRHRRTQVIWRLPRQLRQPADCQPGIFAVTMGCRRP